jgi:RNA polymerase sigma-70 factor (ECF subfamily)
MDEYSPLIARIAQGDRAAFRTLYDRASPLLFGILRRYFRDPSDAEDALHDVLVKVWRIAPRFDAGRKGLPWLVTVTRNHAIDVIRARRETAIGDDKLDALVDLADPDAGGQEMRMAVGQCLARLAPERARLILDVYVRGYTYEEAAERFGAPIGTIRTWVHRSILALRECMQSRDA